MESNQYNIIVFPFTDSLYEMPKKELRAYLKWFVEQIPERLVQLNRVVTSTKGYEDWNADFSQKSLKILSDWFVQAVKHNEQTLKLKKQDDAKYGHTIPELMRILCLSYLTQSYCFDVGTYIYKMLVTNVKPDIEWVQDLRNRRNIEFGEPLIKYSVNAYPANPIGMVIVTALRFLDGDPDRITEVYEMIAEWCGEQPE